jgi:hypothetical protein
MFNNQALIVNPQRQLPVSLHDGLHMEVLQFLLAEASHFYYHFTQVKTLRGCLLWLFLAFVFGFQNPKAKKSTYLGAFGGFCQSQKPKKATTNTRYQI